MPAGAAMSSKVIRATGAAIAVSASASDIFTDRRAMPRPVALPEIYPMINGERGGPGEGGAPYPICTNLAHTGAGNGMFSAYLDNLPVCGSIFSGTMNCDRCSIANKYPPVGSMLKLRGLLPPKGKASISDGAPVDRSMRIAAMELWPRF